MSVGSGLRPGMGSLRHAAAHASRAVGRELLEVLERLPLAAMLHACDEAGSVAFVNESFGRLFGYAREDVPTWCDWKAKAFPDPAYRQQVSVAWAAAVAQARAGSGRVEGREFRIRCKDGAVRDVEFAASVIGRFWMVTLTDVTRHRQTAESLETTSERMRLAADAAGFGFWTRDLETEIEEWDDQMLRIYGLEREEFRGRWEPHVHPDDLARVQEETRRSIEQGVHGRYRYRIVRPDGSVRHVEGMSTTIRDSRGRPTHELGVNFDVTAQVEAETALAAARDRERQREEARRTDLERKLRTSLSAAAAAHEIKQPLSRILMETQLTIERLKGQAADPGDMAGYLETMLAESQHVVDMVTRMKALLRNADSKQGPVEVGDVVAGAILHARRFIASRGVTLHEAGLDRPARIHGDGVQVQTAVSNLIRNAVEAAAEGDSRRREVAVKVEADAGGVTVAVGDSGPGMPDGVIADLPLVSSKPDGTGLGLYLVRTCMENHGGTMSIGRSPLGGAEVRLLFPSLESRAS